MRQILRDIIITNQAVKCYNEREGVAAADLSDKGGKYMGFSRKEAFFGVHFDCPAEKNDTVGEHCTKREVQEIIDDVDPDFIQYNTKHGVGYTTYYTKIGKSFENLKKDTLKIWREVTSQRKIGLYGHYAVWFNQEYIDRHPDFAQQNADGTKRLGDPKPHVTYDSPYADSVVIPQLCELAGDYGLDGVWLDCMVAECIGDYRPEIVEEFKNVYGIDHAPKDKRDPDYYKWLDFTRMRYTKLLKHITEEVHKRYPDFEICAAWDYTTYNPVRVDADIDFISGDVWGNNTVNEARIEARYISQQGKPWDLMPWAFASTANDGGFYMSDKSAVQLMQVAAVIIAQGGGVQPYIQQNRDGTVDMKKVEAIRGLSEFCKARKPYCFGGKTRSQIAIFLSRYASVKINPHAFGFWDGDLNGLKGITECLINAQQSVDIVSEHHLDKNIDNYRLVVVAEWADLNNKEQLLDFARNGGSLLIIGAKATELFQKELGVNIEKTLENQTVYIDKCGLMSAFGSVTDVNIVSAAAADIIEEQYFSPSRKSRKFIAATVNDYGKGKIAGIYFDMGNQYLSGRSIGAVEFIKDITVSLIKEPLVNVSGSRYIETVLREIDGKLHINLINGSGPHNNPNTITFDEILPLNNIEVDIRCVKKPEKIMLQPENTPLEFEYENSVAKLKLEKLELYSIIEVY